tara:strand:+ start:557 stop:1126 length:570 start_codon:yes stop_codon:yes gene_type:complete
MNKKIKLNFGSEIMSDSFTTMIDEDTLNECPKHILDAYFEKVSDSEFNVQSSWELAQSFAGTLGLIFVRKQIHRDCIFSLKKGFFNKLRHTKKYTIIDIEMEGQPNNFKKICHNQIQGSFSFDDHITLIMDEGKRHKLTLEEKDIVMDWMDKNVGFGEECLGVYKDEDFLNKFSDDWFFMLFKTAHTKW